jgi:hypothetical protein
MKEKRPNFNTYTKKTTIPTQKRTALVGIATFLFLLPLVVVGIHFEINIDVGLVAVLVVVLPLCAAFGVYIKGKGANQQTKIRKSNSSKMPSPSSRHKGEVKMTYNGLTFWAPKPISNEEYQEIRQRETDALERKYDLSTVAGIDAIPVPKRKELPSGGIQSVTGRIEYYLMAKAGRYEKAGEVELALSCYRKANQIMPMSAVEYQYDTYMRLPRYLRKLRRFNEARSEESKIKGLFPGGGVFFLAEQDFIKDMINCGHSRSKASLLYVDYKRERQEELAKAQSREDYEWMWEHIPEFCPKSFSAYMRMRNAKTEKYIALISEAERRGRDIQ